MGSVYKAYDRELDRLVAIKVIRPGLVADPSAVQRFKQELLLGSKVSHKHILRIHDLGEVEGLKYISMAYVDGEDLHSILRREGRLPIDRAVTVARQIGEALAAAHAEGVIHRDLKPHNILIDRVGYGLRVGLRPREVARFGARHDAQRGAARDATLHGARAGLGRPPRSSRGSLRVRPDSVRDGDGDRAFSWRLGHPGTADARAGQAARSAHGECRKRPRRSPKSSCAASRRIPTRGTRAPTTF